MVLEKGARLGPYEIIAPLGAGGMGEVYKAKDTRLDRVVAVKVLPGRHAEDPAMRERFEREARMVSALAHPSICALYDVGEQEGTHFLVMEYMEGETLAARLARGPLPLDQALRVAAEIAVALAAAHRRGIVHRDLKPGNVMLTKGGPKLLDFGLAKLHAASHGILDLAGLETVSGPLTEAGAIVGTLHYMAPEQLEGREVDARSDVFAFGCLLYEMVSGSRAFEGKSQASVIGAILHSEPATLSSLQPLTPPALDRLVRVCLAKDPEARWQSARDAGLQLEAIAEGGPVPRPAERASRRGAWRPWLVAGLALAVAAAALLRWGSLGRPTARPIRFTLAPPEGGAFGYRFEGAYLAVSPDGSRLAYTASDPHHGQRLWLRTLDALEAQALPGTEGATSVFFSPDGRSLGFFAESKLKRLDLAGGAPVGVCDVAAGGGTSGTWGRGGDILFAGIQGEAIQRVSAAGGGAPTAVIRPDPQRGERRVAWPWFLPDGKRFLYFLRSDDGTRLMLSEPGRPPRAVTAMASQAQYCDPGYLLFASEGTLLAQRFDVKSGRLTDASFSIAERVRYFASTGSAGFATSLAGTFAYQAQDDVQRVVWFDRTGKELGTVGAPGRYLTLALAPDGRRLLFSRAQPRSGVWDVWSTDLERGVETRISSGPESRFGAVWLPDGKSVLYSVVKRESPHIYRRELSTEEEEEVVPVGGFQVAQDVSPDGRVLAFAERPRGSFAAFSVPLRGDGPPTALLPVSLGAEVAFSLLRFSPDGRFIAFVSDESGQLEAYVTPYPGPGERTRVSSGGSHLLRWSRDGKELIYLSADRRLVSVPIRTDPTLQLGEPTVLFELKGHPWIAFDVSADGERLLAVVPEIVANELPLTVVVDGLAEPRS